MPGAWMRFRLDRRWAMLVVAVLLGATGGSLLGLLTAPGPAGDTPRLAPPQEAAAPTTQRPRGRVEGTSSTRPRPAPTPTGSTARPTTTTAPPTSTTLAPTTTSTTTTTTTTLGQGTTSTGSSTTVAPSSTSTTT
jgi:hypothetical protein